MRSRRPRRRPLLALALIALSLPACGKKGNPLPPLRRIPPPVTSVHLAQRGDQLEITYAAPRAATDGGPLPVLELEILRADAAGDLDKVSVRHRRSAAPGETLVEVGPLPALATTVRVTVKAIAKGHPSVRGAVATLTVQPVPAAPTALTATLTGEGVALEWRGEKPVVQPRPSPSPMASPPGSLTLPGPAPVPSPLATPPPASPNPAGSAPPGPSPSPSPTPPPFAGGFWVYRRPSDGAFGRPLFPLPTEAREFLDAGAPLGQTACYVVRAVASTEPVVESAASDEACVLVRDITPPAPPEGLTALAGEGLIELTWSPSPEADLDVYRLYRSTDNAVPSLLATVPAGQNRFDDKGALPGVVYRYTLTAVDKAGNESGSSNPAQTSRP
jgi:predicted small lipoprotein YifL